MRIHIEQTQPLKINTNMGGKDREMFMGSITVI